MFITYMGTLQNVEHENVQDNIIYTGEKFLDRSMLPQSALDYYDSTYASKKKPHPKKLRFMNRMGR